MRVSEIISEAHHSVNQVGHVGPWNVEIDSHAEARLLERGVDRGLVMHILVYAMQQPDVASSIPIGRGAYFQDINSRVSLYIKRLGGDTVRLETVLDPSRRPSEPMFRRPVPAFTPNPVNDRQRRLYAALQRFGQQHGADALSQAMEKSKDSPPPNREQRRHMDRLLKRQKI